MQHSSSFPIDSLLFEESVFENPRPAPKPKSFYELAKSIDEDELTVQKLLREVDSLEAATEVEDSRVAPTTTTNPQAAQNMDFELPGSSFPFPYAAFSSDRRATATPTRLDGFHQLPVELSPKLELEQYPFFSIIRSYGQEAISPKTKTLDIDSETVLNAYGKREQSSNMATSDKKRLRSNENVEPRSQKWEQPDLPLRPSQQSKLADVQPIFTNPWDGNKVIESYRTGEGVVYSTEAAWHKRATAKMHTTSTRRQYFGSDDDEVYIPPRVVRSKFSD